MDGRNIFEVFPGNVVVVTETNSGAFMAALWSKVILTTCLALYLRNFGFVSSGSAEQFPAQMLQFHETD